MYNVHTYTQLFYIPIDSISTDSAVGAGIGVTVVDVCFTQTAVISGTTDTLKRVNLVYTLSSVKARITGAVVIVTLTSTEVRKGKLIPQSDVQL